MEDWRRRTTCSRGSAMHALHNMTSRQLRCGGVHDCVLAYPDNKQQQAPCRAHTS